MQHPTLPCIFSSMTLFFGCHALAANMFVLVSPKDSPKRRNKKKPLWLKTNSVAGSCAAAGCCLPACHHQTAPNTALDQQRSCCRAVAEGPCGDESQHGPRWLRSGPYLTDGLQAQGCASRQCLFPRDWQHGQAGCKDRAVLEIPLPQHSQGACPSLFHPRSQNC